MNGMSPPNLKYMRRFAGIADEEFVQQVAAQLPWFHNCVLLDNMAGHDERVWYARADIQHGWSWAVLVHQIATGLHRRQGKAITNFDHALPPAPLLTGIEPVLLYRLYLTNQNSNRSANCRILGSVDVLVIRMKLLLVTVVFGLFRFTLLKILNASNRN